jgi:hypothetical protein
MSTWYRLASPNHSSTKSCRPKAPLCPPLNHKEYHNRGCRQLCLQQIPIPKIHNLRRRNNFKRISMVLSQTYSSQPIPSTTRRILKMTTWGFWMGNHLWYKKRFHPSSTVLCKRCPNPKNQRSCRLTQSMPSNMNYIKRNKLSSSSTLTCKNKLSAKSSLHHLLRPYFPHNSKCSKLKGSPHLSLLLKSHS